MRSARVGSVASLTQQWASRFTVADATDVPQSVRGRHRHWVNDLARQASGPGSTWTRVSSPIESSRVQPCTKVVHVRLGSSSRNFQWRGALHSVSQQRVDIEPCSSHLRGEVVPQPLLQSPEERSADGIVMMLRDAVPSMSSAELAHRRDNRVEPAQPIDGHRDHCSQLAPLLAQIVGTEQGSRAWIQRKQSVVEQPSGFILDGKQPRPGRLHQLYLSWGNHGVSAAAKCYGIQEGGERVGRDRRSARRRIARSSSLPPGCRG
jgi:hypothetical protein